MVNSITKLQFLIKPKFTMRLIDATTVRLPVTTKVSLLKGLYLSLLMPNVKKKMRKFLILFGSIIKIGWLRRVRKNGRALKLQEKGILLKNMSFRCNSTLYQVSLRIGRTLLNIFLWQLRHISNIMTYQANYIMDLLC